MTNGDMKEELARERVHVLGAIEWGLLTLCGLSLLAYLHYSRAAEAYLALYVMLYKKLRMILGM